MYIALDVNNQRTHINNAISRGEYFCPCCNAPLVVKKGDIIRHHFAHMPKHNCRDSWHREYDISKWHYDWQKLYPEDNQEIQIDLGYIIHRADVMIDRTVVEFQHSSISAEKFANRNNFYFNLDYKVIWLFDFTSECENKKITAEDDNTFKWSSPKNTFKNYTTLNVESELFFQLVNSETDKCIVKISEVSSSGFEKFFISGWYTKEEFLRYTGVTEGACALPDRNDLDQNEEYKAFSEKYNIVLNKQQERAVQSVEGATLLLAVPGSGKTTVLVNRIGYMVLCKNIEPEKILALTYTRAAAADMKARFSAVFGVSMGNRIQFSTINALANDIIKTYSSNPFKLFEDESKRNAVLRKILQKLSVEYPSDADVTDLATKITYIKNIMLTDEEISEIYKSEDKTTYQAYYIYKNYFRDNKLMDYDDQLVYAHTILKTKSDILEYYQNKYQYICVDEAQDTSKIQHRIIKLLAGNNNIFMVGDEDQSIYGFRGAYPKALTDFRNNYNNPHILKMEYNYRSTDAIVDISNRFISQNIDRYQKTIVGTQGEGNDICLINVLDRKEQYETILNRIKSGTGTTGILYRDNDSALPLIDILDRNNIDFKISGIKPNHFNTRVINDVKSFLKFIINPMDAEAFNQIYYKMNLGFKKNTVQWAINNSKRKNISICEAMEEQLSSYPSLLEKAEELTGLVTHLSDKTTVQILNAIADQGYGKYIRSHSLGMNKFTTMCLLAANEPNPSKFLKRLQELENIAVNNSHRYTNIILSTIHSSKGLEYDNVYLLDVYDGVLPSDNHSKDEYQEERRLFYVGMTRAKKNLNLFNFKRLNSSFVFELFPPEDKEIYIHKPLNGKYFYSEIVKNSPNITSISKSNLKKEEHAYQLRLQEQREFSEQLRAEREKEKKERLKNELAGYEEVKDRFNQQVTIIKDSFGIRWIKCEQCGEIKPASEFITYGGVGRVNLGTCSDCSNKKLNNSN